MNLARLVRDNAEQHGSKTAIRFHDETISYAQLWQRIEQVAAELHERGVNAGDRVGLSMSEHPNHPTLLVNLGVGLLLSLVLRWHFQRFGSTLSNRAEFASIFPFIVLTTVLIITVVKSSLALSLGLVGALSIVRFRTPIKEPEELLYIFVAIAIGLGLGANQVMVTVIGFAVIVLVLVPFALNRNRLLGSHSSLLDLVVQLPDGVEVAFSDLEAVLKQQGITYKLKRAYRNGDRLELLVDTLRLDSAALDGLRDGLRELGVEFELSLTSNARVIT